jgi:6-phosphogluconate dehydrogenase
MSNHAREIGIVGLGKMGESLALHAMELGFRVAGNDRSPPRGELTEAGLVVVDETEGFADVLTPSRAVLLYIPAGPAVDDVVEQLAAVFEEGDVIVDAGNSYWRDSIRRQRQLAEHGLGFVDLGTSGGISGARDGACFMAGGERWAVERIEPILIDLAAEGGYVHAGPPGAGHFTKLVHNGIEFGMLQAIGEGVGLLERYEDELPIAEVLRCWRNGSVIRSWLVDLMHEQYVEHEGVERIPSHVEDTGEVNWLVEDAMRMEVPTPVIATAVMELIASRDSDRVAARAVAMMRHGFGGHPFGPDAATQRERQHGRVTEEG